MAGPPREDGLLGEAFFDARALAAAVGHPVEGRLEDTSGFWRQAPAAAYLAHAAMRTAGAHFNPSPDPFPLMALAVAQYAQTAAIRQAHAELLLQPPYSLEQADLATQPGGAEALAAGWARFQEQGGVGLWHDRWREWVWAPQLAQVASAQVRATNLHQCDSLRDLFGPLPFRPVRLKPAWLVWESGIVPMLAQAANDERAFDRLPLLADALEEAGCPNADILSHLRGPGPHVCGCWSLALILGKE
jgi:hypothetical protein